MIHLIQIRTNFLRRDLRYVKSVEVLDQFNKSR